MSTFDLRTPGTALEGMKDDYADGRAAKVWDIFIGDKNSRTEKYRTFLVGLLRKNGCKRILDVACGTGVDSVMLIEEGFQVTSIDASDKMLKHAFKTRWNRRKEPAFDNWEIRQGNWLTLNDDISDLIEDGHDAVICLGNSFTHILDHKGDQVDQRKALINFKRCIKPGGLLLIDHRNYDKVIETGYTPSNCVYYNSKYTAKIMTFLLYIEGRPSVVRMDYFINVPGENGDVENGDYKDPESSSFHLSCFPHRLNIFKSMLQDTFGPKCSHTLYADFKRLDEVKEPAFYIHVIEKAKK